MSDATSAPTSWSSTTCPRSIWPIASALEELEQNIVAVTSGEEALQLLLEREFAVILLDVNMPGMAGLETAALIRQRRKSRAHAHHLRHGVRRRGADRAKAMRWARSTTS